MRLEAYRAIAFLVSEQKLDGRSGSKKRRERENEGSREDNRGFVFLGRDEKKPKL